MFSVLVHAPPSSAPAAPLPKRRRLDAQIGAQSQAADADASDALSSSTESSALSLSVDLDALKQRSSSMARAHVRRAARCLAALLGERVPLGHWARSSLICDGPLLATALVYLLRSRTHVDRFAARAPLALALAGKRIRILFFFLLFLTA